ncbi:Phosphate regulon sensor protein PhoR [Nymphon striatum]|nr:Phosphate regulon sensor protein PhoR [Nymphon striatum]
MLSGYWFASLSIALTSYIAWLLYKLQQLHSWLERGATNQQLPDNDGIWERISHQVQGLQKKSDKRKRRMANLLKRFQGIITGLPYATVVLNGRNEIDWANKISKEYLNIEIKRDRGQRIDNLIRVPEVQRAFEKNSTIDIEVSLPHNSNRQIALQLIPVEKDLKLLIARDISERENTLQMRKNFIANASHELRTPLTVIAGYLEIMQEDDSVPEHLRTAILSASDQSNRMQSIIEDLLTLSRLENSSLNDKSSTIIDIPSLLLSICGDEKTLITNNSHTIKTDIDYDLKIKGSAAEITSVCSNLIHNSIRHTQDGTEVTVQWKKTNAGEACLHVIDNGQGIPSEHLIHLTERFYRVDKGRSRDKGGTGLGLAIVQHIIQRHGGKLSINSKVSKGSTFSACFPEDRIVN